MNSKLLRFFSAVAGGLLLASNLPAQTHKVDFPAASPACTLKQRVGLTDIEIVYSRPGVKDRAIFGGLIPYGQVWRTGANAATKITFSTAVKLNGTDLPAGTYALFTIPGEDEWTIIISKNVTQSPLEYDEKGDVVRFKTTPITRGQSLETFTIEFNLIRDESAVLNLVWDKTVVPIKIDIALTDKLVPQIEAAMAATFYYNHDQDLKKALDWVNAGLADNPGIAFEILHLKAQILAKQGNKEDAIAAATQSIDLATKAQGATSSFVKMNQDLIASLQAK